MKRLAAFGFALSLFGCHAARDRRPVVLMGSHEGDYLWVFPVSQDKLGSGGELQIYLDAETHPEASASFAKYTLGVAGALPVHRHDKTEEIAYILSGEGVVIVINEDGELVKVPIGAGYVWYNPLGVWHGIKNTGSVPLSLVFATVPNEKNGLLSFFRRVCVGPGKQGSVLPPEEFERIASEHDLILRYSNTDEH